MSNLRLWVPFVLPLLFTIPNLELKTSRLATQMPVAQVSVGEQQTVDQNTRQIPKSLAFLNVWSEQYQGHLQRQHRTEHKEQTPSPRKKIKISDPSRNRTRAATRLGRQGLYRAMGGSPGEEPVT